MKRLLVLCAWLLVACGDDGGKAGPRVTAGPSAPLNMGPAPHVTLFLIPGLDRLDLGAYGGPARAGLDRLALEGTRFDTFLAPVPDEEVALECLLSGTWPSSTPGAWPDVADGLLATGFAAFAGEEADAFVAEARASEAPLLWLEDEALTLEVLDERIATLLEAIEAEASGGRHLIVLAGTGRFDTQELSDENLAAPLILVWKGTLPAGEARPQVLGLPDLAPTVLELVGSTPSGTDVPRGASFARLTLKRTQAWRGTHLAFLPATDPTVFRLRATAWSYTRGRGGEEHLFDLRTDVSESTDVAGFAGAAEMQGILRDQLREWVKACGFDDSEL